MHAPVQLVTFDLMGTLVRDDGVVEAAYDAALRQAGVPDAEWDGAVQAVNDRRGRPTLDVLRAVLGDPVRAEEATWAFDDAVISAVPGLQPVAGAEPVLDAVAGRGIALAVTTSFGRDVRARILDGLGWQNRFDAQMSAHGSVRGHPAPDLILETILELRVDSVAQVAIVGDSAADLEAGNRAGAGLVIGVLTGVHGREVLEAAPHTHLVDAVTDVPAILDAPRVTGHRRRSD